MSTNHCNGLRRLSFWHPLLGGWTLRPPGRSMILAGQLRGGPGEGEGEREGERAREREREREGHAATRNRRNSAMIVGAISVPGQGGEGSTTATRDRQGRQISALAAVISALPKLTSSNSILLRT